jgi:3-methyladenine DNA glycosylase AlkD
VAPAAEQPGRRAAAELHDALVELADPARADQERAYLKDTHRHLGVPTGPGRAVVTTWVRSARPELGEAMATAALLWASDLFEDRRAAVEIWVATAGQLGVPHLERLEVMVRDARTWALVDPLAHTVAGVVLTEHPAAAGPHVDRWSTDADSFWVRRLSVLSLSRPVRAGVVPFAVFEATADRLLDEREFFVRKAIGWVLRDLGRADPGSVEAFCRPRMARISTVTWREAAKVLAPDVAAELASERVSRG